MDADQVTQRFAAQTLEVELSFIEVAAAFSALHAEALGHAIAHGQDGVPDISATVMTELFDAWDDGIYVADEGDEQTGFVRIIELDGVVMTGIFAALDYSYRNSTGGAEILYGHALDEILSGTDDDDLAEFKQLREDEDIAEFIEGVDIEIE